MCNEANAQGRTSTKKVNFANTQAFSQPQYTLKLMPEN